LSQIDDIINEIVKYVGRAGGLLIILDRAEHALASQLSEPVGKGGVAKFYVDGMKVKEVKYEEYWETEYKISSALDRLGLMVEICDAGRDSSAIFSWRREALTLEEEEERFEWVREKLKENGIEWSENRIRTLIGLKPRMQILVHIPLVLGSPTLGTEKRKVKGTISLQIINEKTSIKVTEVPKTFGREDFRNIIKDSLLKCISGKHFYDRLRFY
jgi:hypothetical protein